MQPTLLDPTVIFVYFENQGGDWVIRIKNSAGKETVHPIAEELTLQFQPAVLNSLLGQSGIHGLAMYALEQRNEKGDDNGENTETADAV